MVQTRKGSGLSLEEIERIKAAQKRYTAIDPACNITRSPETGFFIIGMNNQTHIYSFEPFLKPELKVQDLIMAINLCILSRRPP